MDEQPIKKTRPKKDQDHIDNFFDHLPQEIIIDILSRLPITSLVQFSFTCRSFLLLSRNQDLVNSHLSRSFHEIPCLILHSDYPLKNQLHFLHFSDQKIRKFETPFANSMPEFKIIGSCNGLLCLVNSLLPESIYLFNPFTRDYKELPNNYVFKNQVVVYGFGFYSLNNDYKVIIIGDKVDRHYDGYNRQVSKVQIYSLRKNMWKNGGVVPHRLENIRSSPGALVNGKLHWVSRYSRYANRLLDRVIVSYDLSDDSFDVIAKPCSATRWVNCHLSALDGCICACVTGRTGYGAVNIWVMKKYGVVKSWDKIYNIRAYYPISMISDKLERFHHIWRNMFSGKKSIRMLCVRKSGEVVMEYTGGGLVSYDPCKETFEEFTFKGMPEIYQTTVMIIQETKENSENWKRAAKKKKRIAAKKRKNENVNLKEHVFIKDNELAAEDELGLKDELTERINNLGQLIGKELKKKTASFEVKIQNAIWDVRFNI